MVWPLRLEQSVRAWPLCLMLKRPKHVTDKVGAETLSELPWDGCGARLTESSGKWGRTPGTGERCEPAGYLVIVDVRNGMSSNAAIRDGNSVLRNAACACSSSSAPAKRLPASCSSAWARP